MVSPTIFWFAGFLGFFIPFLIIIHVAFFLRACVRLKRSAFFYLIMLAAGFVFLRATFSVNGIMKDKSEPGLNVLSFNVRVFNTYQHLRNDDLISSKQMIKWTIDHPAEIKCLQEYFNKEGSEVFNTRAQLSDAGWTYIHEKIVFTDRTDGKFGLAIFSKHPMVFKGEIRSPSDDFQNTIYCDIKNGDDTVRIYNLHLESMSIDEENIFNTDRLKKSYKDTGNRLKKGFITRGIQVDYLVKHIEKCPYPVVICGDFNELPYSYVYHRLRQNLNNAFESAGFGFGFTYNGRLPFLRIDNQFASEDMEILKYTTSREMTHSDHFPITVSYRLEK